jgi:hypothetical protein
MRDLFWPTKIKPEPGMLVRIGRLIHWLGAACFAFAAVGALIMLGGLGYQLATRPPPQPKPDWAAFGDLVSRSPGGVAPPPPLDPATSVLNIVVPLMLVSVAIYLGTRAIRYVLAGE